MKVLHLGKYYPPDNGGIERVSFDLVEGLVANGVRVDVLCFGTRRLARDPAYSGYRVFRQRSIFTVFSTPLSVRMFLVLARICHEYEIIHLHLPNPVGGLALQLSGFRGKVVLHWHSDIVNQKRLLWFYRFFQTWLLKRSDRIIVTSDEYRRSSKPLRLFLEKCEVVPIGVSRRDLPVDETFLEAQRQHFAGKKIVFSLGRFVYYKGFQTLLEAAGKLPEGYVVLLGGRGVLWDSFISYIRRNGLESRVLLLGSIAPSLLGAYYALCDVFVLPSTERSEAFGVVLAEALSFGKPLVSTSIPGSGVTFVNRHGLTGLAVEPNNPDALAHSIEVILADDKLRQKFAGNAAKHYEEYFRKEDMVERTLSLYYSVLGLSTSAAIEDREK